MKACVLEKYGEYPIYKDVNAPEIEEDDDIIIKVAGVGVCRTDIHEIFGNLKDRTRLPLILGHENTGYVYDFGSKVHNISKNDPVILFPYITKGYCLNCRKGNDMFCTEDPYMPGIDANGGYAEFMKTKIRAVVSLPKSIKNDDLINMAPLADAGITAYHAIKKVYPLIIPDSTVIVFGVGGLGHIAIQIIKSMTAAKIIAIDISQEKLELAKKYGADFTLLLSNNHDIIKECMKFTHNNGADIVFDFVGENNSTEYSIKLVKNQGTVVVVGYGGTFKESTFDLIIREINIIGSLTGTYSEFTELIQMYLDGKIKVETQRFNLREAAKADELLKNGKIQGRAVLVP